MGTLTTNKPMVIQGFVFNNLSSANPPNTAAMITTRVMIPTWPAMTARSSDRELLESFLSVFFGESMMKNYIILRFDVNNYIKLIADWTAACMNGLKITPSRIMPAMQTTAPTIQRVLY